MNTDLLLDNFFKMMVVVDHTVVVGEMILKWLRRPRPPKGP